MMRRYAAVAGRRAPLVVRVPVLTPRLSSYWVGLVTPVDTGVARPLVQGLSAEMLVRTPPPPGINDDAAGLRRRRARGPGRSPGRLRGVPAAIVLAVAALLAAVVVGLRKVFVQALPEWLRIVRDVDDTTEIDRSTGAVRSVQSGRGRRCPPSRLDGDVVAAVPRAPGAHLLALPLARDARRHPRLLHRGRALRRACSSARWCS